ncbi:hypothetical protein L9W92_01255 [Pelotomaculum terephthalicicum JT]|uniref:hypothetical protein n=1 Tax=Pelotomaculum TaxID=191373 RepID=UPI0009C5F86B|nr:MULTISPECIES: hypothetical protein [Pelotomaculum]MCG9966683.1 hypothetical protein [Pelotomaculum terephthalicicum JT]OPX91458.1 MAG: hypothetical protein A4E54_00283 [Pelotomaculum sp. PtaB.Bin117]OPY62996.1 MAG: hypothetical protein A4E56_00952 [Pelotomaculum sp. PtaU1.Bin065]
MGNLIYARKQDKNGLSGSSHGCEGPYSQAVVPTIDVYTAKVLFSLTQKMIEDTVDKRVSALEKNIERRDQEVMRTIRRIQAQVIVQQNKSPLPWWKKIFKNK